MYFVCTIGDEGTKIYVGNLNFDTTSADLQKTFEAFGEVSDCFIPSDYEGNPRGFAFIQMTEETHRTDGDSDFNNVLIRSIRSNTSHEPATVPYGEDHGSGDPMDEKYGEVIRLADKGLGAGDISKRVNIPKGEVDLLVKIRRENEVYAK